MLKIVGIKEIVNKVEKGESVDLVGLV